MTFINLGVAADTRSDFEKAQDIQHTEIASGQTNVDWKLKDPSIWKKYTLRNQDGSFSCMAQSASKALEIIKGGVQSAHPIYRQRSNFPGPGMFMQDLANITTSKGTTSEILDPSQNMSEEQMNQPISVSVCSNNFISVNLNPKNIDEIAYAVENYKHCILIVYGSVSEWIDKPVYNPNAIQDLGHAVCAVDYFYQNGEKCLLIDDSWGKATTIGNGGQRIITESYLKARFNAGMYFIPRNKPKAIFSAPLIYGTMKSSEVSALQDILKYEGFFPKEIQSTGNFLQITAQAIKSWQLYHGITDFQNEIDLRKIRFGLRSIALANSLYS